MTMQTDDDLWSAIADPSRRRVIDLIVSNGEVSASWLATQVPFSRQAVSKHLVLLEHVGLVSRRKQGREVLYKVEANRLDHAAQAMAELAAQWDRRLSTIKRLAEAAQAEAKTEAKARTPRSTGIRRNDESATRRSGRRRHQRAEQGVSHLPGTAAFATTSGKRKKHE